MSATLFGVPASHPSLAAELMLRHKGIRYRRIDLVAVMHRGMVRALGFPGSTVPAMGIDGARVQGTKEISAALESLQPSPPLFPADPERRRGVLEAEAWGDTVLQPVARRLVWAGLKRDRSTIGSYLENARNPVPVGVAERIAAPIVAAAVLGNKASDSNVQGDLAELPHLLDRVDDLLEQGTIGGDELNAADFQIATSTALLATMGDVRPLMEGRAALGHARRVVPGYPGRLPRVFPPAWLPA